MNHSRILSIGEAFPQFTVPAVVSLEKGKEFALISSNDLSEKWTIFFFWALDFTFICPVEIADFNKASQEFKNRKTQILGASCDSQYAHLAWRQQHPDLKNLTFPMLSDYRKELSETLGILHPIEKIPLRATYIIDPQGVIRWLSLNDLNIGRNVKEILRMLDALQKDDKHPQKHPGEDLLSI